MKKFMRLLAGLLLIAASASAQSPRILSAAFTQATSNVLASQFLHPTIYTNFGQVITNRIGGYSAGSNLVTIEWESVAGRFYAVECSPIGTDATPIIQTNATNSAIITTNDWIGEGWTPRSFPVQATGVITTWTGGVWGSAGEMRFYRIKEF